MFDRGEPIRRWFRGKTAPYTDLDVCPSYECKKRAGLVTEATKSRRRARSGGDCGGRPAKLRIVSALEIAGHRLIDAQTLAESDPVALREPLGEGAARPEWLVRGKFAAADRPADAGIMSYEWVGEAAAVGAKWPDDFRAAVQAYFDNVANGIRSTLGAGASADAADGAAADEPATAGGAAAAPPLAAAAAVAAAAAAGEEGAYFPGAESQDEAVEAPSAARSQDGASGEGGEEEDEEEEDEDEDEDEEDEDEEGAAGVASARHELLVLQLAAHLDDARLSLAGKKAGVLARLQEKADFTISQSALSIWLGRAKNCGVTASLFAKIDDVVATYLASVPPTVPPTRAAAPVPAPAPAAAATASDPRRPTANPAARQSAQATAAPGRGAAAPASESPQPLFCPNCTRRRLTAAMSSTHLNCGGDEAVCVCPHS